MTVIDDSTVVFGHGTLTGPVYVAHMRGRLHRARRSGPNALVTRQSRAQANSAAATSPRVEDHGAHHRRQLHVRRLRSVREAVESYNAQLLIAPWRGRSRFLRDASEQPHQPTPQAQQELGQAAAGKLREPDQLPAQLQRQRHADHRRADRRFQARQPNGLPDAPVAGLRAARQRRLCSRDEAVRRHGHVPAATSRRCSTPRSRFTVGSCGIDSITPLMPRGALAAVERVAAARRRPWRSRGAGSSSTASVARCRS